ncbi:MAG: hypothetical protein EZS28_010310 [Streblomastix strix]|uniref:RRM domain-containing protein n=1 Tax=Streblomastix strix TaxID=222440 RepID=A0A5J4WGK1_9EUKA|nr:MAG: hypothetical protein EZS28_010310 [Streblomastix strix]
MTIIVSNLADGVTDADLLQLFESYGQVLDCEMCGKSAIVILKENAIQAKVELNGMFTRKVQKELTINQYSTTNKLIAQILESDKSNQDEDDTIIKLNRIHLQIIEDEDTIKLGQIMVKEYLNTEHNILPHLSNIIIIISSYVSVIPSNQFLLQALVKLSKYKIGDIISHYSDNQPSSIRNNCRESLNRIQQYGDALAQNNISQAGYATSLVASFSSNIQFNKEYFVSDALFDLNSYFEEMLNGRYCIRIKIRFPRQPTIVKISLEQIEEEGGNEEIDFHIHNKGEGYFRNQQQIRKQARFTLEIILNAEQDQSNR